MSCPDPLPVSLLQEEDEGLPSPWIMDPSDLCEDHGDRLTLFCLDDLEPLCPQSAAERHTGHRVYLLTEAAADCKGELRSSLNGLKKTMVQLEEASQSCEHAAQHNRAEAELTEQQMVREFELLHHFLREEEAARLRWLREEHQEKKRAAHKQRDAMTQLIQSVEEKIHVTEEELRADGDGREYLQNYQDAAMNSAGSGSCESPQVCSALIQVSSHLGNLQHSVWDKMKVTFDPRAAGRSPRGSPRFNGVTPGRGRVCLMNLSGEGLDSGEHCWDIQVGDATRWLVGVAPESVSRGTEVCPEAGQKIPSSDLSISTPESG